MTNVQIDSFDIEQLHPKIWVFKNAFKQSQEMIDYFENTVPNEENELQEWKDWYVFGSHIPIPHSRNEFDLYPSEEEWFDKVVKDTKNPYAREMCEVFYKTSSIYVKDIGINLPNWKFDGTDIAKYYDNVGINDKVAMAYHTDYERAKNTEPGSKFAVTVLFYLNGDYGAGEVCFRVFNEDCSAIIEEIKYKPNKGDVVVFPSGDPRYTKMDNIFHGVEQVSHGVKYLVRAYWKYVFEGEPEYWEEKAQYEDEVWNDMLKERRQNNWDAVATLANQGFLND
jgi:hypothetical protein